MLPWPSFRFVTILLVITHLPCFNAGVGGSLSAISISFFVGHHLQCHGPGQLPILPLVICVLAWEITGFRLNILVFVIEVHGGTVVLGDELSTIEPLSNMLYILIGFVLDCIKLELQCRRCSVYLLARLCSKSLNLVIT